MIKNMGKTDRIVRLISAVVLLLLYFTDVVSGTLGIIALIVAGIFVVTSSITFFPLYWPFVISTMGKSES